MWMIEPPPRARIGGITMRVRTEAPTRLMRSTSAKSAAEISPRGALRRTAAELTSTSTPPHSPRASSTSRATSPSAPASPATARPVPPAAVIASTTSRSGSGRRPNTATRAPSRAKDNAMARPMPVPPPATIAVLPSSAPKSASLAAARRPVRCAEAIHGAGPAARRARGAPGGPEVHQGLVVVVRLPRWHERAGEIPDRLLPTKAPEPPGSEEHPAEHAPYVRIHDRHRPTVGEAAHRPGGVAADAPHAAQQGLVVGQPPAVARDRLAGNAAQVDRADVVAERIPEARDLLRGRAGEALEGRIAVQELVVLRDHPVDLRLLQHDLGDQDAIRVFGAPPRQVAAMLAVPGEQTSAKTRAGGRDGQCGRRHGRHCVRDAGRPAS